MRALLPPADFGTRFSIPTEEISADGPWWRLARVSRPRLVDWDGRSGESRFVPKIKPHEILYLAADKTTAFWEVFGGRLLPLVPEDRVLPPTVLAERQWVEFEIPSKLKVFPATAVSAIRDIGGSNMSFHGEWTVSQEWGRALWNHPAQIDGIVYRSDKNTLPCLALFRRPDRKLLDQISAEKRGLLAHDGTFLTAMRKRGLLG